jgi:hypothetical protein
MTARARPMAALFVRLTPAEVGRLPLYVQEEIYRLNLRLEECSKAYKLLRREGSWTGKSQRRVTGTS